MWHSLRSFVHESTRKSLRGSVTLHPKVGAFCADAPPVLTTGFSPDKVRGDLTLRRWEPSPGGRHHCPHLSDVLGYCPCIHKRRARTSGLKPVCCCTRSSSTRFLSRAEIPLSSRRQSCGMQHNSERVPPTPACSCLSIIECPVLSFWSGVRVSYKRPDKTCSVFCGSFSTPGRIPIHYTSQQKIKSSPPSVAHSPFSTPHPHCHMVKCTRTKCRIFPT